MSVDGETTDQGATQEPVAEEQTSHPGNGSSLLEVDHLQVHFPIKSGVVVDRKVAQVHAVDDVSFDLKEGETLGIVGESGCGKTTLIRTLVRLLNPTGGAIRFRGADITNAGRKELAPIRREMQMVFQDPQASLNPRKRVAQILATPLRIRGVAKDDRRRRSASCSIASGCTPSTSTGSRTSSPAASASGSGSPGRWPSTRS